MPNATAFLTLALCVTVIVPARGGVEGVATVIVEKANIFDQPSEIAYVSSELDRGTKVFVVHRPAQGWLAIEPPAGSVVWVEASALKESDPGQATISRDDALLRSGHQDGRFPGPPLGRVELGTVVQSLKRPPVKFAGQAWRAIAPPVGQTRFVRAESLRMEATRDSLLLTGLPLPQEIAEDLKRLDASVQGVLRSPPEDWQFGPLIKPYRTLLDRASTPQAKAAVQTRLDRIETLKRLAKSAREFRVSYTKSRAIDRNTDQFRGGIKDDEDEPFDAEGLVQVSSKMAEGQRVHALIGKDGTTVAYLELPAGIDASRWEGRRAGVRGLSRYDEDLRAPLITVRDIEKLDLNAK